VKVGGLRRWFANRRLVAEDTAVGLGLLSGQKTYTRFVILGRSRTGSNYLRSLLESHPNIVTANEILRDGRSIDWGSALFKTTPAVMEMLHARPTEFLKEAVFRRFPKRVRAVGFKLFYYHARHMPRGAVWDWLQADRALHVIHLKRRNILRTHLSKVHAMRTGRWFDSKGQTGDQAPVTLDFAECLQAFEDTRAAERENDARFAEHPVLQIAYEDLVSGENTLIAQIQSFLHLPQVALTQRLHQQSQLRLTEAIRNYGELKAAFGGTSWAGFFEE